MNNIIETFNSYLSTELWQVETRNKHSIYYNKEYKIFLKEWWNGFCFFNSIRDVYEIHNNCTIIKYEYQEVHKGIYSVLAKKFKYSIDEGINFQYSLMEENVLSIEESIEMEKIWNKLKRIFK